ncbi:catenin alpha-1-like [Ruditapes philippinarum]|uniref:catenin alpha-1-like n=1 Tax=Ruditapes philippinarum TaxID=129788 RepID=UPI00295AD695|nr:catenin alpha-1-like [Ruditapes philippinarum]
MLNASQALEQSSNQDPSTVKKADGQMGTRHHSENHSTASTSRPVIDLLKNARYIETQTDRWEDNSNPIVKVAKTMATQIKHMTQYVRREGPINNHLALVETAKALAENSDRFCTLPFFNQPLY